MHRPDAGSGINQDVAAYRPGAARLIDQARPDPAEHDPEGRHHRRQRDPLHRPEAAGLLSRADISLKVIPHRVQHKLSVRPSRQPQVLRRHDAVTRVKRDTLTDLPGNIGTELIEYRQQLPSQLSQARTGHLAWIVPDHLRSIAATAVPGLRLSQAPVPSETGPARNRE